MESIPGKLDRYLAHTVEKFGSKKYIVFTALLILFAVTGALLWGTAAIGSSRQFRLLTLIAPLLISYLIRLFAGGKNRDLLVFAGWLAFVLSLILGKYLIFTHFHSVLPHWLGLSQQKDFYTALAYLPHIFNATHLQLFFEDIAGLIDPQDGIWLMAGFYIIWRNRIFSPKQEKTKENKRKLFKRRFQ
ncbi:MAG: hypothetical protein K9J21_11605 [Bacteroidales bacterium]|nr:hypothetical protein [Bacteroidales bacterium]